MSHDQLKLYSVSDDPEGFLYEEERWWIAIWAKSKAAAVGLAIGQYPHQYEPDVQEMQLDEVFEVEERDDIPAEYSPPYPMIEKRPEVMRLIGYRYDDEIYCEACNLAAMGMPEYEVCSYCDQCKVCGHDEGCNQHPNAWVRVSG